jgi:IS1 family transposase
LTKTKENVYITLAVTRNPRQIVGFTVTLSRSVEQMQGLIDSSPAAQAYYSDGYLLYKDLCYWGVHTVAHGKSQTYTVEGVNADLRRYLPGVARRSRCFYRRLDTLVAVMKVFVTAYNRFGAYKSKHQVLANHRPTSHSRLHKFAELPLALINFF